MTRPALLWRSTLLVLLVAGLSCTPPTNTDDNDSLDFLSNFDSSTAPTGASNPRTVADLAAARTLPPVPSANVGLRLVNRLPRELRIEAAMLIRNEFVRVESRVLPAGETIVIGPDEADRIELDARTSRAPAVAFQRQVFLLGADFRPNDVLEFIFEDLIPPTIECPPEVVIDCAADLGFPALGVPATRDDLGVPPTLSFTDSAPGDCRDVVIRTWTATDDSGNTSTCEQRIIRLDQTPPTIELPTEQVLGCVAAIPAIADLPPLVTDNCDPAPSVVVEEVEIGSCPRIIERTWRASDACGNVATAVQRIRIEDTTPPEITIPGEVRLNCGEDLALVAPALIFDACDPSPLVKTHDSELQPCPRVIERLWTATDACGNFASATQRIVIEDTTAPNLFLPPDVRIACGEDDSPEFTGHALALDDCDPEPELDYEDAYFGECPGSIERTWIARDACGNERRGRQIITIEKLVVVDQPPVVLCPPHAELFCDEATDPESLGFAEAVDDFDPQPLVFFEDELVPGCPPSLLRAWYAVDSEGQLSEPCYQLIDVLADQEPPDIDPKSLMDPFDALCGDAITPEAPRLSCAPDLPAVAQRLSGDPHPERVEVAFVAQGQIGDLLSGDPRTQPLLEPTAQPELLLRRGPSPDYGFLPRSEADFDWFVPTPGGFFEFELSWDPFSGLVFFRVGQTQLVLPVDVAPDLLKDILIRAVVDAPGARVEISRVSIEELQIMAGPTALPQADVSLTTAEERQFGRIGCGSLTGGFTLRGRVALLIDRSASAQAPPTGGQVAFQIIAGKYTEPPGTGRPTVSDNCTDAPQLHYFDLNTPECGGEVVRIWVAEDECGNIATIQQRILILPTLQISR